MNALSALRCLVRNSTQWPSSAGTAYFLAVYRVVITVSGPMWTSSEYRNLHRRNSGSCWFLQYKFYTEYNVIAQYKFYTEFILCNNFRVSLPFLHLYFYYSIYYILWNFMGMHVYVVIDMGEMCFGCVRVCVCVCWWMCTYFISYSFAFIFYAAKWIAEFLIYLSRYKDWQIFTMDNELHGSQTIRKIFFLYVFVPFFKMLMHLYIFHELMLMEEEFKH